MGVSVVSVGEPSISRESALGKVLPDGVSEAFKIKYVPFNADTGVVISKGQWLDAVTGSQVQRSSNLLLGSNIGFELKDLVLYDADGKYLTSGGKQARDASGRYISVNDATTGDQLKLSGEVFIKNSAVDVDININNYDIKRAGARFNGTLETKLVFDVGLKETFSLTDVTGQLDNSLSIGDWFKLKGIDYGKERIVLGSINIGVSAAGVPVVVLGVGNSITTLPLAIVVALSVGMNGTIDATASFGADYKAYFDKGAYYVTNSSGNLVEEKKFDIVAHGDTPNPNVPNSAAATAAELAKKPEFRTFVKGQATVKTKSQIGIDASLAIAGMVPLQLSNTLQYESEVGVKGSINGTSDRPGQFDVVGCAVLTSKAAVVSTLYARLVGESDWLTLDGIDKKRVLGTYSLFNDGYPLTCTQQLGVDFSYEVNPADATAPPAGQYKVRFKPDAQWKALTALAISGKADVDTWSWSYGDISLGNLLGNADENPVHTYSSAGSYTVELKIKDSYGQSAKITKTLVLGSSTVPNTTSTTTTTAVPATPALGSYAANNSAITLTWASVSQATYYQLLRSNVQLNGNIANVYYVDTSVTANNTYTYQLKACNTAGCSASSPAVTITAKVGVVSPPVASGLSLLNDTGITASQCYQAGSDVLVSCTSSGALALNASQDGMTGRDAVAATNSSADGKLGFNYTKIGANGETLTNSATAWSCVKDNATGRIWEVKTNDSGLRDSAKTYTNYDNTSQAQLSSGGNPTLAQVNAATNSIGFKNAVNAAGLCGASDWRLPTADELQGLVDYGVAYPGPTIDANWFPNTVGSAYWGSTPRVGSPASAWNVDFGNGNVDYILRSNTYHVRLVR